MWRPGVRRGGDVFVGKRMNCEIGRLAASHGIGGLFPWAMSYDAFDAHNNTLVTHLMRGYYDGPSGGR